MKRKGTKKRGVFARLRRRQAERWRAAQGLISPFAMQVWPRLDQLPLLPENSRPAPYNHRKRLLKFEPHWRVRLYWALKPAPKPFNAVKYVGTVEAVEGEDRLIHRFHIREESVERL
jgi:hypothetical protein